MDSRNPSTVILLKKKVDFNEVTSMLGKDWKFECNYEVSEQSKFMNYTFVYESILFSLSEFDAKFPEDLTDDIKESYYVNENEADEFYEEHNHFGIIAVLENKIEDINRVYALFTRVIMSILNVNQEALVYDTRSRLVIEAKVYLQMYPYMQTAFEQQQDFFPTEWYVDIQMYQGEDGISAFTQGFSVFNDYEIEIHNKPIEYEELYRIMKYIITNVVSRQDKISNGDMVPVPISNDYEQAIVKQFYSKILEEDALAIIF